MRTYRGPAKPMEKTPVLMHSFWSKVPAGSDGCWEWQGSIDSLGYGRLEHRGSPQFAHRVAMFLLGYPLQNSEWVLHHCDNPRCVRPSHLFVGTPADNTRDMCLKGRAKRKLMPSDVSEIKVLLASGSRLCTLARKYGVSGTAIAYIRSGKNWKHHVEEAS